LILGAGDSDAWELSEEYATAWGKYQKTAVHKRPIGQGTLFFFLSFFLMRRLPMLSQKLEMKKFSALVIEVSEEDRRTKKFRKLVEQEVRVDSKSLKAATAKTSGFLFFFFCDISVSSFLMPSLWCSQDSSDLLYEKGGALARL